MSLECDWSLWLRLGLGILRTSYMVDLLTFETIVGNR